MAVADAFAARADGGDVQALEIISGLREAARTSELHKALGPVLVATVKRIQELLIVHPRPPPPPPPPPPSTDRIRLDDIDLDGVDATLADLRGQILGALRDKTGKTARLDNVVIDVGVVDMPEVRDTIGMATRDESHLDTSRPGDPVITPTSPATAGGRFWHVGSADTHRGAYGGRGGL